MNSEKKYKVLTAVPSKLLTETFGDEFEVTGKRMTQEQLANEMKGDYDAVIGSIWTPITENMIKSASSTVKAIATYSIGYDHIDVDAANECDIEIVYAGKDGICASAYSVAEHAFGMLLANVRKVTRTQNALKENSFSWKDFTKKASLLKDFMGGEFFGKTLGIVGVGRIGVHIARIGKGFRMKAIGYDPYVDREKVLEDQVILMDKLEELLSNSDFVAISSCLTEETKKLIGKEEISMMKDKVHIVNIARGEIVDEAAVIEGLENGDIAGYATDVLTRPPTVENSPLLSAFMREEFPNLLLTPHISALTREAQKRYPIIIANRIKEVLTEKQYPRAADYLKG